MSNCKAPQQAMKTPGTLISFPPAKTKLFCQIRDALKMQTLWQWHKTHLFETLWTPMYTISHYVHIRSFPRTNSLLGSLHSFLLQSVHGQVPVLLLTVVPRFHRLNEPLGFIQGVPIQVVFPALTAMYINIKILKWRRLYQSLHFSLGKTFSRDPDDLHH